MESWLEGLQHSSLAEHLRFSLWTYPLVNAAHILGLALIVGAVTPLDLRLVGLWRGEAIVGLARVLLPVAIGGFLLAAVTGALMFIVQPRDYLDSTLFLAKLALIALALANAAALHLGPAWREHTTLTLNDTSRHLRLAGAASLALWTGAIVLGRLIGYR